MVNMTSTVLNPMIVMTGLAGRMLFLNTVRDSRSEPIGYVSALLMFHHFPALGEKTLPCPLYEF